MLVNTGWSAHLVKTGLYDYTESCITVNNYTKIYFIINEWLTLNIKCLLDVEMQTVEINKYLYFEVSCFYYRIYHFDLCNFSHFFLYIIYLALHFDTSLQRIHII